MDSSPPNRLATVLLAAPLLLLVGLNVALCWRQPVWAPRNELAHYDYIHRVATLRYPGALDPILAEVQAMTVDGGLVWKRGPGFDGSIVSMGLEGLSYEAHQPPLYYAIMAVPDALLSTLEPGAATRIRLLRVVQFLLLCAPAMLLMVPIFRELEALAGTDARWGWVAASAVALTSSSVATTLGNDAMSLLPCQLAMWAGLRALRLRDATWIVCCGAFVGLAMLTKLTNGLLLPAHGILVFWVWRKGEGKPPGRHAFTALALPVVMVGGYLLANVLAYGDALKAGATMAAFEESMRPMRGEWRFTRTLLTSAFQNRQLGLHLPGWGPRCLLALLVLNTLLPALRVLGGRGTAWERCVLVAALFTWVTLGAALVLNAFKPGVNWSGARHFHGYQAMWWIAFASLPVALPERVRRRAPEAAAALLMVLALFGCWELLRA